MWIRALPRQKTFRLTEGTLRAIDQGYRAVTINGAAVLYLPRYRSDARHTRMSAHGTILP